MSPGDTRYKRPAMARKSPTHSTGWGRSPERSAAMSMVAWCDGILFSCTAGQFHAAPEAASGGPIAALKNGDIVRFDIPKRRIEVKLTAAEIKARLKKWKEPKPRYKSGVMAKYARSVSSSSRGAVTW